jgi:hypothetical protein
MYNNHIVTVEKAISYIKNGIALNGLYLVDDNCITTVLAKARENAINGEENGYITAPNNGEKVIAVHSKMVSINST